MSSGSDSVKILELFLVITLLSSIGGCGEEEQLKPEKTSILASSPEQTDVLFGNKVGEDLGDKFGKVELQKDGIFIHPGEGKPTTVRFDLGKQMKMIVIRPFIDQLSEPCKASPDAGVVDVEFMADGKVLEKLRVDRLTAVQKTFDLSDVQILSVRVDQGNETPQCDWFKMSVVALK
jgi:hypothetical protein